MLLNEQRRFLCIDTRGKDRERFIYECKEERGREIKREANRNIKEAACSICTIINIDMNKYELNIRVEMCFEFKYYV